MPAGKGKEEDDKVLMTWREELALGELDEGTEVDEGDMPDLIGLVSTFTSGPRVEYGVAEESTDLVALSVEAAPQVKAQFTVSIDRKRDFSSDLWINLNSIIDNICTRCNIL